MVVLDASFLVALMNDRDAHHSAAAAAQGRVSGGEWGPPLLPEYVFLETVTVLMRRRGIELAIAAGRALLNAREVEFLPCTVHFDAAWQIFERQRDPALSFTDACILAITLVRGDTHVATFDERLGAAQGVVMVPS